METYLLFLSFIMANSYFMYKAGERAGKFTGMISITQKSSLSKKVCLKIKKI